MLFAAQQMFAGTRMHFLSHGPSAAAYGRGETGTTSYDDIASIHYNPSLLAGLEQNGICFTHYPLYSDAQYNYFAIGRRMNKTTATAVSIVNLGSGDVELRQKIDDIPSIIQTNHWAYNLTSATHLKDPLEIDLGMNIKYVYEDIAYAKGGGIGMDAGASKTLKGPRIRGNPSILRLGFAAQNLITPKVRLVSDEETLECYYRMGASLTLPGYYRFFSYDSISIYGDVLWAEGATNYHAGLEYVLFAHYFLRLGYFGDHLTVGFGYHPHAVHIDYAADFGPLDAQHRLTISYYWNNASVPNAQKTSQRPGSPGESDALMKEARRSLRAAKQKKAINDKEVLPLFRAARKDYRKKRYLSAADKFRDIMLQYPEYNMAGLYYDRITDEMDRISSSTLMSDFESLSYARGYNYFRAHDFVGALNEWEKVLQIDPDRDEIVAYESRLRTYMKDIKQRAREREIAENVQRAFDDAVRDYDNRKWVSVIKKMEKIQETCQKEAFPDSLEWHKRSQEYISKSVQELSLIMPKSVHNQAVNTVQPSIEIDPAGADRKYNDGLILYAQGKITEAIRLWEITLRLDPGHGKARKALQRAKEELELPGGR